MIIQGLFILYAIVYLKIITCYRLSLLQNQRL